LWTACDLKLADRNQRCEHIHLPIYLGGLVQANGKSKMPSVFAEGLSAYNIGPRVDLKTVATYAREIRRIAA
jgi:hypothetical protein